MATPLSSVTVHLGFGPATRRSATIRGSVGPETLTGVGPENSLCFEPAPRLARATPTALAPPGSGRGFFFLLTTHAALPARRRYSAVQACVRSRSQAITSPRRYLIIRGEMRLKAGP